MDKEQLLEWVKNLPDDAKIFMTEPNEHDCVDIKVFTKPKTKDFLEWYFGP